MNNFYFLHIIKLIIISFNLYEMYGIYILSSKLFDNLNVVKFGMSTNFSERLKHYESFLDNPYYAKIYKINDDIKIIRKIESDILKETKELHAVGWQTEYRNMTVTKLNEIIINYLKTHNYSYDEINPLILKKINTNDKSEINKNNERIKIQDEYFNEIFENIKKNKSVLFRVSTDNFSDFIISSNISINILYQKINFMYHIL